MDSNPHKDRMTDVWTEWMEARADGDADRAQKLSAEFWEIGSPPSSLQPVTLQHHFDFLVLCNSPDVPKNKTWPPSDVLRRELVEAVVAPSTPPNLVLPLLKAFEDPAASETAFRILPIMFAAIVKHGFGTNSGLVLSQFFKRRVLEVHRFNSLMSRAGDAGVDQIRVFVQGLLKWARPDDGPKAFLRLQPVDWIVKLDLPTYIVEAVLADMCATETLPPCPRTPYLRPFDEPTTIVGSYLGTIISRFGDSTDTCKQWLAASGSANLNLEEHKCMVEWKLRACKFDVRNDAVVDAVSDCLADFPASPVREYVLASALRGGFDSDVDSDAVRRVDIAVINRYQNLYSRRLAISNMSWECNVLIAALYARKYELAVFLTEEYGERGCTKAYASNDGGSGDGLVSPLGVIRQIVESGSLGVVEAPLLLEACLDTEPAAYNAWCAVGGETTLRRWSQSQDPIVRTAATQLNFRAVQVCSGRFVTKVGRDLDAAALTTVFKNMFAEVLADVRVECLKCSEESESDTESDDDDSVHGAEESKDDIVGEAVELTPGNWRFLARALLQTYGAGTATEEAWLKSTLGLDPEKVPFSKRWFKSKSFSPNACLHGVAAVDVAVRWGHNFDVFVKLVGKPGFHPGLGGRMASTRWGVILDTAIQTPELRRKVIRAYLETSPPTPQNIAARLNEPRNGGIVMSDWVLKNSREMRLLVADVTRQLGAFIASAKEREDALVARIRALETALAMQVPEVVHVTEVIHVPEVASSDGDSTNAVPCDSNVELLNQANDI